MNNMEYIRKTYGVPARRGMRVIADGKEGIITGAKCDCRIRIRLDGYSSSRPWHPTWHMKYFDDDGKLLAEYGD